MHVNMLRYYSIVLRDVTFIEHYFLDKIVIYRQLSVKISFKLLQLARNNILP